MDTIYILTDKFDSNKKLILSIGICKTCGRETVLVHDECAYCIEDRLNTRLEVNRTKD